MPPPTPADNSPAGGQSPSPGGRGPGNQRARPIETHTNAQTSPQEQLMRKKHSVKKPHTHIAQLQCTTCMYNEQHTQKALQAACMCVSLTLTLSLLSSAGHLTSLDPPTGQEQCLSCQHQTQRLGSTQLSSSSSSTGVEQSPGQ